MSYLKSFPHHLQGNYLVLVWIVSICLCKVLWTTFLITSILKLVYFLKLVLIFVKSYSSELKSLQKSVFYCTLPKKKNNMSKNCGGLGLNGIQLKGIISTNCNWKNQNPGSPLRATSWTALPIWPIWPKFEVNGWIGSAV